MSGLLVLTAVEVEARGLARALGLARVVSIPGLRFEGRNLAVVSVGLGANRLAARAFVTGEAPALVVSAGTCGALAPTLDAVGALVVPEVVLTTSGDRLPVDPRAHAGALGAAARAGHAAATGSLLTTDRIVETPAAKAALWRETGAVAVDMESAPLVRAARAHGVPALVVRAVSDTAEQVLPREFLALVDGEGRARPARAAGLALRRPALIGRALALRRGVQSALEVVAAVLAALAEDCR